MHHFAYRGGTLCAEDIPLTELASTVGTPAYVYSSATLERHFRVFSEAVTGLDALICFAVKANGNLSVLRTLAQMGAGADVVSEGEMVRALTAGIPPEKIVFSGVGKSARELISGLDAGILQFNVESEPELDLLSGLCAGRGQVADVAIRVNPDIDAGTHEKISTGKAENKFGIAAARAGEVFARANSLPGLRVVGIAMHIGSQITSLAPLEKAFDSLRSMILDLRARGITIERADVGGGLGIPYEHGKTAPPVPARYGEAVRRSLGDLGCGLIFEPGRMIAGNAGILLSQVLYVKQGEARRFIVLDAAMNDLIRPALYDAWHEIWPVRDTPAAIPRTPADVVGPVCESGDTFARSRPLPPLEAGDLVAILSAGAYGAVQASTYNSRPLVPEVLVRGSDRAVVRPRPAISDLVGQDRIAPWLKKGVLEA